MAEIHCGADHSKTGTYVAQCRGNRTGGCHQVRSIKGNQYCPNNKYKNVQDKKACDAAEGFGRNGLISKLDGNYGLRMKYFRISRFINLISTSIRIFFMAPPVEPEQPPIEHKNKKDGLENAGHVSKFTVEYPLL